MLANRGVEPERIHSLLANYIHDPEQQTRFWAVEGLAHLGTDETIKDFLDAFAVTLPWKCESAPGAAWRNCMLDASSA